MKIGIDARPLQHETQYRGIGKALESLLLNLGSELSKNDLVVFYLDGGLPKPKILDAFPTAKMSMVPAVRLGRKRYWRSFLPSFKPIDPASGEVDVVLQYDAGLGIPKKVPSVVVFHDLIPYLFRGQEKQRSRKGLKKAKDDLAREMYWRKYLGVLNTYQRATKIIAISQSSKNDLLKHTTGIQPADVVVIALGLIALDSQGKPSARIRQLAKDPYLMYVGGIDLRKNLVGLLETFYKLKPKHPDLRLITVGKEFHLDDQLDSLGWFKVLGSRPAYAKDVIKPGFISAADLHYLYQHAAAFVLASRYEGFGLPVLEAMAAGCPVVAYDNSSIGEVAGDAAILVKDGKPLDPAINKLLNDPGLRAELIAKGKRQAAKFPWSATAKKTLELLRQTAAAK
jgi:glycosyltransferase involved in cell wall biosynthesis